MLLPITCPKCGYGFVVGVNCAAAATVSIEIIYIVAAAKETTAADGGIR